MCGNQLYVDAWRVLQELEDMNGIEKFINQGISQKVKEESNYGSQGYGDS